jgi:hypothetical protein
MSGRASLWRGFTLGAAGLLLAGCISYSVTNDGAVSSQERKQEIENSHFYRDSTLFFPADVSADPRALPKLTKAQRDALERDLNAELGLIRTASAHPALAKLFGALAPVPAGAHVVLTDRDAAEAKTNVEPPGSAPEIAIDTRVVQSMLRSALVSQYSVEIDLYRLKADVPRSASGYTADEERIAIDKFLTERKKVREAVTHGLVGDLLASRGAARAGDDPLDMFGMSLSQRNLSGLDVRYDSELFFLIAHEVGHVALAHFGDNPILLDLTNTDSCSERRAKEDAADAYATALIALGSGSNAVDDMFGGFMTAGSVMGTGLATFFSYAYDYAGFATPSGGQCQNYSPPAERMKAAQALYEKVRKAQIETILRNAKPL